MELIIDNELSEVLKKHHIYKRKNHKLLCQIGSHQYLKRIIGDKAIISSKECCFESNYTLENNILSISYNNQYLSARRNGNIGYVSTVNEWEKFMIF